MEIDAESFAAPLKLRNADHKKVCTALSNFPALCKSRGMFATGILEAVSRVHGKEKANSIREIAGYPRRINPFGLYPHEDFYRLYYSSAAALYPEKSLADGMRLVAEDFYPIFTQSLVGRTMSMLIGNTPQVVLGRFIEAYKIATPWCEHSIEASSDNEVVWKCKVEPCANYAATFAGICTGMVRTVTGIAPQFEIVSHQSSRDHQRFVFRITW